MLRIVSKRMCRCKMQRQAKRKKKIGVRHKMKTKTDTKMDKLPQLVPKGEKQYTFYVYLTFSKTVCTIKEVKKTLSIKEFKKYLVLTCGVPYSLQRLYYLDSCELNDADLIKDLDLVDNASFRLGVWSNFEKILRSVHEDDFDALSECDIGFVGDSKDLNRDPNADSETRNGEGSNDLNLTVTKGFGNDSRVHKNAGVALFVASQLGNLDVIKKLLDIPTADVNWTTNLGYTALHAATSGGHYECIDYLLQKGAYCDTKSEQAKTAMKIAEVYGFQESERHLRRFEWQSRAKTVKPSQDTPLMMHQMCDSHNPTWMNGEYSTKYICSNLPTTEFSGTRIDAPLAKPPKTPETRKKFTVLPGIHVPDSTIDEEESEEVNPAKDSTQTVRFQTKPGLPFDAWLKNKQQQALIEQHELKEQENLLAQEKEELEKKRRTRKLTLYEEEKKRKSRRVRDNDWNRSNMYQEYKYLPSYETSIIQYYMSELMLDGEGASNDIM